MDVQWKCAILSTFWSFYEETIFWEDKQAEDIQAWNSLLICTIFINKLLEIQVLNVAFESLESLWNILFALYFRSTESGVLVLCPYNILKNTDDISGAFLTLRIKYEFIIKSNVKRARYVIFVRFGKITYCGPYWAC